MRGSLAWFSSSSLNTSLFRVSLAQRSPLARMTLLKRCCCCWDLRGGSLAVGIISFLVSRQGRSFIASPHRLSLLQFVLVKVTAMRVVFLALVVNCASFLLPPTESSGLIHYYLLFFFCFKVPVSNFEKFIASPASHPLTLPHN